jgi:hypothetical protein
MNHDQDYDVGTPIIFTKDIFSEPYPGYLSAKKGWKGKIKYKSKAFDDAYIIWQIDKNPNTCIVCTTDQFEPFMNKETLLHYLRLPYNVNVDEMRKARDQAADELERLYELEERVKQLIIKLEKHEASCVHE